jgi:hypothetical protein
MRDDKAYKAYLVVAFYLLTLTVLAVVLWAQRGAPEYQFSREAIYTQQRWLVQQIEDTYNHRLVFYYLAACRDWERNKLVSDKPMPEVPTRIDFVWDPVQYMLHPPVDTGEPLTEQACGLPPAPAEPLPENVVDFGSPINVPEKWIAVGPLNTVPVGYVAVGPDGKTYELIQFLGLFGWPVQVWEPHEGVTP